MRRANRRHSSDDDGEVPEVEMQRNNVPNLNQQPGRPALEYNLDGPRFDEGEFGFAVEPLGQGAQGTVRRAVNLILGSCAVKQMAVAQTRLGRGDTLDAYNAACRNFLNNRQALQLLQLPTDAKREFVNIHKVSHHDNIVSFRGYLTKKVDTPVGEAVLFTGLIFEFMAGGTLENMIQKDQDSLEDFRAVPDVDHPPALDYSRQLTYAIGIAKALTFLHEKLNIIHRHIHPSNIFLTGDFSVAKLGDFGYAREKNEIRMSAKKGAIKYMAPEVIQEDELVKYDFKAEVWSFAMLLYAMLCKCEPCLQENGEEVTSERRLRSKLLEGSRPILGEAVRRMFPDMVKRIEEGWQKRDAARPSMKQMLQSLVNMADGLGIPQ